MKVYKIYNKVTGEYFERGYKGTSGSHTTLAEATRAVAHTSFAKKNVEIHGFDLTHVTTRTNQDGGKWNAEVSIDSIG